MDGEAARKVNRAKAGKKAVAPDPVGHGVVHKHLQINEGVGPFIDLSKTILYIHMVLMKNKQPHTHTHTHTHTSQAMIKTTKCFQRSRSAKAPVSSNGVIVANII